jgi:magnesium-transporting ATPase (P-type)
MITVILIILFAGEYFIPEENETINGIQLSFNGYIRTGRKADYEGNLNTPGCYTYEVDRILGSSRHFSILFTTFVFMQIINEWNCRKLYEELNIFSGILSNPISITVRILESVVQAVISQFGGRLFGIYPAGMTWYQWLICIGFSLGSFLIRLFLLLIPAEGCSSVIYTL